MQTRGTFLKAVRVGCGLLLINLTIALPGRAAVLYNNLGNASGSGYVVGASPAYTPAYQGFSTDGSSYHLTSVTVGLFYDGNDSETLTTYLYSDVGGSPGSELANLGTILDGTIVCCGEDDIPFSSPAGVFLAANTTYFVYLQGSGPGTIHNALWAAAVDDSGVGVAGQPGMGGPPAVMEVQATATPEPGAGLLLAIGLGLFSALTRRRSASTCR